MTLRPFPPPSQIKIVSAGPLSAVSDRYRAIIRQRVVKASQEHVKRELAGCRVAGPSSWSREHQVLQEACQRLGISKVYVCKRAGKPSYALPPDGIVLQTETISQLSREEVRLSRTRAYAWSPVNDVKGRRLLITGRFCHSPPPIHLPTTNQLKVWMGRQLFHLTTETAVKHKLVTWLGYTALVPALLLWKTTWAPIGFVFPMTALLACADKYSVSVVVLGGVWTYGASWRLLLVPLLAIPGGKRNRPTPQVRDPTPHPFVDTHQTLTPTPSSTLSPDPNPPKFFPLQEARLGDGSDR